MTASSDRFDEIIDAPRALAPLIGPNVQSYGRAPTFLMRTSYEQVRSVVAALAPVGGCG